jgi:hypothetical protein
MSVDTKYILFPDSSSSTKQPFHLQLTVTLNGRKITIDFQNTPTIGRHWGLLLQSLPTLRLPEALQIRHPGAMREKVRHLNKISLSIEENSGWLPIKRMSNLTLLTITFLAIAILSIWGAKEKCPPAFFLDDQNFTSNAVLCAASVAGSAIGIIGYIVNNVYAATQSAAPEVCNILQWGLTPFGFGILKYIRHELTIVNQLQKLLTQEQTATMLALREHTDAYETRFREAYQFCMDDQGISQIITTLRDQKANITTMVPQSHLKLESLKNYQEAIDNLESIYSYYQQFTLKPST